MAGLSLQYQALEDGEAAANRLSKRYKELAGGYPAGTADSSIFGKLDDSSALAGLLDEMETEVGDELGAAQSKLSSVGSALDKVWTYVYRADTAYV
ncbi:hypothetical protein ACWGH8_23250 [Nonomuraea muscovyensis]|uniref:Uncharacterized protein n=1 Tax=Nonomuraea muscovyensis TaxID=1124761 RepID=A0A7X0EW47_9ACTN|nr:hypothetical protein [Nonomuraea muscovyensis]MBB6346158.1 hypothetical protein [Nonomuraea muscovyensis]MDF2707337.1 hypothetical protein [Nonomuraea muscovyensis]